MTISLAVPADQGQEDRYHYRVIARALRLIEAEGEALTLDALATRMGMSPAHFQKLFSAWAGISPKRYQQFLSLNLARRMLTERATMIDAAGEAGLSGTGRLHDLFLRWEAMSPGAFARGGDGLALRWGRFDTPFGPAVAMATDRGLCGIAFAAETGTDAAFADLAGRWPAARFVETPQEIAPWVEAAMARQGDLPVAVAGGPFQIKVWEALLAIPPGRVDTYSGIARAIGQPGAARAVGTAVGRNPLAWLIPCHRVIGKSGAIGGYHWGLPVKRAMLAWEAAQAGIAAE